MRVFTYRKNTIYLRRFGQRGKSGRATEAGTDGRPGADGGHQETILCQPIRATLAIFIHFGLITEAIMGERSCQGCKAPQAARP